MTNRSHRLRLVALALPVLLAACSGGSTETASSEPSTPQNKIIGTWAADVRAMMVASLPEGRDVPPQAEEMLKDSYITVAFNADGTNTMASKMGGEAENEAGRWELVSQEGTTYRLKLTSRTKAGGEKTQTGTAVFSDDDNVTLTIEGEKSMPPMILKRQK